MKRFIILFMACSVLLVGCAKRAHWNQKMTLRIDTPNGPVVASGVVAVNYVSPVWFKQINNFKINVSGEAIVVDMDEGRTLFALLGGMENLMRDTLRDAGLIDSPVYVDVTKAIKAQTEPLTVPPKLYPMLVTFDDVTDPKTVRRVSPANLAASFGTGYALRKVTLEITRERVTKGVVEGVLPCLNSGKQCVPLNETLKYGHPMRNILNSHFRIKRK